MSLRARLLYYVNALFSVQRSARNRLQWVYLIALSCGFVLLTLVASALTAFDVFDLDSTFVERGYEAREVTRESGAEPTHTELTHTELTHTKQSSAGQSSAESHRVSGLQAIKRVHASTPDRLFLPYGSEIDILEDVANILDWVGERSHLEPWYGLHPPLSIGSPKKGRLLFGHKMREAFGLWVMEPEDSYTSFEVALTLYALNAIVRRVHPGGADLMVLDIAQESGGRFKPHRTHQSGSDVDLRYYIKSVPPHDHEKRFVHASKLDLPRMWTLFRTLVRYDLAELVFMDHRLQKAMYQYGKTKLEMTERELRRYLSYPSKGRRGGALARHVSNHYHHMHVRLRQETSHEWRDVSLKEAGELQLSYLRNRTGFFEYVVQSGQTLGAIARFNRVRLRDLLKWNKLTGRSIIRPGQILKVWR